jgi:hypothetical protein
MGNGGLQFLAKISMHFIALAGLIPPLSNECATWKSDSSRFPSSKESVMFVAFVALCCGLELLALLLQLYKCLFKNKSKSSGTHAR